MFFLNPFVRLVSVPYFREINCAFASYSRREHGWSSCGSREIKVSTFTGVQNLEPSSPTIYPIMCSMDNRYTCDSVTTHDGDKLPCVTSDRLLPLLHSIDFMSADVIAVDEAQFFPDLVRTESF